MIIEMKLHTERTDAGRTANYRVYAGGGLVTVSNGKGEAVSKNAVMGGQGTIYLANPLVDQEDITEVILIDKATYTQLVAASSPAVAQAIKAAATKVKVEKAKATLKARR